MDIIITLRNLQYACFSNKNALVRLHLNGIIENPLFVKILCSIWFGSISVCRICISMELHICYSFDR